jgi:hypothetical protein
MTLSMTHLENMLPLPNFNFIFPVSCPSSDLNEIHHTMFRTALALLLLAQANVVTGQKYNFHLFEDVPYVETGNGEMRFLQSTTNVNTPDLTAATDICTIQSPNYVCQDTIRIDADDLSFTDVTLTFGCTLDSGFGFDYRRSSGCVCQAEIVHSDTSRPSKICPCSICPIGFGDSPIAIDCTQFDDDAENPDTDPFIIDRCSSLDCGFGCNGTCSFDCVESGPECEFCSNANDPTSSPTGTALLGSYGGGGGGGNGGSSAFLHSHGSTTLVILLAGAAWMAL